jgi:hypothetical protein
MVTALACKDFSENNFKFVVVLFKSRTHTDSDYVKKKLGDEYLMLLPFNNKC